MYRDTVGRVTVGVGLMLPDASAAAKLPFQVNGAAVAEDAVRTEFARVDALPMGRPALFYRARNGPELPKPEIDALLRTVLTGFENDLRGALHGYDALPDGVRLALLDMIYNLGPAGLLHGYPRMLQAIQAGEWAQAAAACERRGPGAARNEWTRQMMLGNVVAEVEAAAEGAWKRFGYGLVGAGASALAWWKRR